MKSEQSRYGGRPPGMPGPFEGAPVTKWLLIINAAILILMVLLTDPSTELKHSPFYTWGSFSIQKGLYEFQLWRFLSFQFLHGSFGHLLANCIGLYFFGPHIERWMSSRVYLTFYILCGIAGILFYAILFYTPGFFRNDLVTDQMVGASAGLFGILAAFYFIAPQARVLLFFIIPMKMKTLALAYFAWETFVVIFDLHNAGGSAGHLGGAIFGLAVLKWPPLKQAIIKLSQIGDQSSAPRSKKTREAKIIREKEHSPLEISKEVDRILDKISEQGIQSLTPKEKETLNKARRDK